MHSKTRANKTKTGASSNERVHDIYNADSRNSYKFYKFAQNIVIPISSVNKDFHIFFYIFLPVKYHCTTNRR